MNERYICIHGHFYQPPRENPWLEEIELQDSAYPYHDWNERVTDECYKQNAASRILGPDRSVIDIVNNYSRISFDFGPTLLSWLQRQHPEIYQSIIDADVRSREIFSGHGSAIAQAYNHIIMPLANSRDKYTQIYWGLRDFEHRFGRKAEGMWLPETAVDLETLDYLAELGIKFTILAPHQVLRIRKIGARQWENADANSIDTTRAYLCRLKSGRTISIFFYHGPTAHSVAGGHVLQSGEVFAQQLAKIFGAGAQRPQLAHIAADGETYGHHFHHADMALTYCLHYIEQNNIAKITVYGQYLEKFPPVYEVEIKENTSWSCSHGVERWRSNCGCYYGRFAGGLQQWREPLREAMDWLRDQLATVYQAKMAPYNRQPWQWRDKYISVILDRSEKNIEKFLADCAGPELDGRQKTTLLKLFEMQRNAMLMYTSCGWFFDDISGIETIQVTQYAARAIQLAKEIGTEDFEPEFMNILEKAQANAKEYANGRQTYEALAKTASIDLNRVGAHMALSSVFERYPEKIDIYCYSADIADYERLDAGRQILATGRATIKSTISFEEHPIDFAVLHFGDHNLIGAVNARMPDVSFLSMRADVGRAFSRGDTTEVMRIMNLSFAGNNYSLWHLFKDAQRRILDELLQTTWQEIEASFRHVYEHNYTIIQMMRGLNIPLPKALSSSAEFVLNLDLSEAIQTEQLDLERLLSLANEASRLSVPLDKSTLGFHASRKVGRLMEILEQSPVDNSLLETVESTMRVLLSLELELDLQRAQNVFFTISRQVYPDMLKNADGGDIAAQKWVEHFRNLADYLGVCIQ